MNGDTSTFYWNTKPVERYIGDPSVVQEEVYTVDDYRVTIDTTESGGLSARCMISLQVFLMMIQFITCR